jgi:hypothetical protein
LVDLIWLTDDMHRLVLGQPPLNDSGSRDSSGDGFVHGAMARGCFDAFAEAENLVAVWKTPMLSHFYISAISLPRQARDTTQLRERR